MTTSTAVKRHIRRHTPTTSPSIQPLTIPDVFDDEFDDSERQLLAWLEQATTTDPILLNVRRILAGGEEVSWFHWRVLRRAFDDADAGRYRYGGQAKRRADRLARQQAEVIARREANSDRPDEDLILGIQARASVGIEPTTDEVLLLEQARHLEQDCPL